MTTNPNSDFMDIFTRFQGTLGKYAGESLNIREKSPSQFELIGPPTPRSNGREVWFGAVRVGKRYVSYYLMPVYACPDLLEVMSPALKKRMQGKSCFNFTRVDDTLFNELEVLTSLGYKRFKDDGWIE
jgi:hypothetical protein